MVSQQNQLFDGSAVNNTRQEAGNDPEQSWNFGTVKAASTGEQGEVPQSQFNYSETVVRNPGFPPSPIEIPSEIAFVDAALPSGSASSRPHMPDAAPLKLLVQPALRNASGGNPQSAAAAESTLHALSQLEAISPGATRTALLQMITLLGSSGSPSLADLKSSAQASLGNRKGPASDIVHIPASLDALSRSDEENVDLGPLGNFLLSRWQDEVARESAASL